MSSLPAAAVRAAGQGITCGDPRAARAVYDRRPPDARTRTAPVREQEWPPSLANPHGGRRKHGGRLPPARAARHDSWDAGLLSARPAHPAAPGPPRTPAISAPQLALDTTPRAGSAAARSPCPARLSRSPWPQDHGYAPSLSILPLSADGAEKSDADGPTCRQLRPKSRLLGSTRPVSAKRFLLSSMPPQRRARFTSWDRRSTSLHLGSALTSLRHR